MTALGQSIYSNRSNGSSWVEAAPIENSTDNTSGPHIAALAGGFCSLDTVRPDHAGTHANLWANRYNGTNWWTPFLMTTDSSGHVNDCDIAWMSGNTSRCGNCTTLSDEASSAAFLMNFPCIEEHDPVPDVRKCVPAYISHHT